MLHESDERDPRAPVGQFEVAAEGRADLKVSVRDVPGDALVVRPTGEVDLATSATLRGELTRVCARADGQRVVLDLAEVEFLGSAGLQVLLEVDKLCRRCGLEFEVVNPQLAALRALRVSGVDKIVSVRQG